MPVLEVQTDRATQPTALTHLTTQHHFISITITVPTAQQQIMPADGAQRSAWVALTTDQKLSAANSATAGNPAAEHPGAQWPGETDPALAAVIARAERHGHIGILASMSNTLSTARRYRL